MTKTHRKATSSAVDSFHRHYAAIWGEERWNNSLYPALLRPTRYACLLNLYATLEATKARIQISDTNVQPFILPRHGFKEGPYLDCFVRHQAKDSSDSCCNPNAPPDLPFPSPEASSNQLLSHWNLDAASILVAELLDVQSGDNVLDLCAAPGGKSIALAQRIWPHFHGDDSQIKSKAIDSGIHSQGNLHSNEIDGPRHRRLAENLKLYLPKGLFETGLLTAVRVDGSKPNAEYNLRVRTSSSTVGYDRVLVDAPCSSERHIVHAHAKAMASGKVADEMTSWRPGSSKRLAKTQIDLLMTGLKAANTGGSIMYATCSIDPTENDGVVSKVIAQVEKERKKGARWNVQLGFNHGKGDGALEADLEKNWAERTQHGWIVLPDHPSNGCWGPLFFAMLTKVEQ